MDFASLVRTRITGPLGMTSTAVVLPDRLHDRLVPGHDAHGTRVPNWDFQVLAGAGAVRSTASDLLRLLAAQLGYDPSPLGPAMRSMLAVRRPTGTPGLQIALGWHLVSTRSGREIAWQNGGTGGYRSFIGFDPAARTGVVVLSNMSTTAGVDDIGMHLLDPSVPLAKPPAARTEISLTPDQLAWCVGRYELRPDFVLTVTREDGHLFVQATGQPRFELFAESPREFFLKAVEAQITFEGDGASSARRLILHQNGRDQTATRIE